MGVVYEAEDVALRRRVAQAAQSSGRARRAGPARGARLDHPNIAAVYDAHDDAIVMQFVDGKPLSELARPSVRALVGWIRDAARAVHHAHEQGTVHRDLKRHNLMIAGNRVVVTDFGLAKELAVDTSLSLSGSVLGTPSYMPPEQAGGRAREVDARSDVYSLGATLYDRLAGRPPFMERDLVALRQHQRAAAGAEAVLEIEGIPGRLTDWAARLAERKSTAGAYALRATGEVRRAARLEAEGKTADALAALERAADDLGHVLTIDPGLSYALCDRALVELERARLLASLSRPTEARAEFAKARGDLRRAIELAPSAEQVRDAWELCKSREAELEARGDSRQDTDECPDPRLTPDQRRGMLVRLVKGCGSRVRR